MARDTHHDTDRAERRFRILFGVAVASGVLTALGWLASITLAFLPPLSTAFWGPSCSAPLQGPPTAGGTPEPHYAPVYPDPCDPAEDWTLRGALGASLLTAPVAGLWIWSLGALPRRRDQMRAARSPQAGATGHSVRRE